MRGISDALQDEDIALWYEFLDTKRHPPEEVFPKFVDLIKEKHRGHPFDIIITSDNNAFSFMNTFREDLFQGIPFVFCGVNNFNDSLVTHHKNITGVAEDVDFHGTIELILRLHPKTRFIATISDNTRTGQIHLERIREIKPFFKQIDFIELTSLTADELAETLKDMPRKTVILLLSYFLDRKGNVYTQKESSDLITSHSPLPIYSSWDFYIKHGVVGGIVTSGYLQGINAGELAARILQGESADSLPIIRKSPNTPMFDYEQLKRLKISTSALPDNSTIINEPESFYYQNKKIIWSVVFFLLLQMTIIIFLVVTIRRRKLAEIKLSQYRDQLEEIVKNRTEDLTASNKQLEREIQERHQAEENIKMSHAELDQIFNTVTDGMRVINKDYEIVKVNNTFLNLTGLQEKEIIGKKCYEIFPGPQCDTHECTLHQVVSGSEKVESEVLKKRPDGRTIPCIVTATPFHDTKGKLLGLIEVFKDITLRKALEKRLFELSITDELTSLLNRRGFIEMSDKQLSLAERSSGDLFLLFVDLDNMKWINDHFGHSMGDKALAEAAHLLLSTFRDSDIFGRLGGDEFAVLLTGTPGMNSEQAIMKRLQKSIERVNKKRGRQYKLSMSVGIVKHDHKKPLIIDELIEKADAQMYEAKKRKKQNNEENS